MSDVVNLITPEDQPDLVDALSASRTTLAMNVARMVSRIGEIHAYQVCGSSYERERKEALKELAEVREALDEIEAVLGAAS